MNAYIYQAALLCEDCAIAVKRNLPIAVRDGRDSEQWPVGPYTDGGGESDSPQHCDHCVVFLENPLTSDGEEYVKDGARRNPEAFPAEWREYYSYLFRDTAEEPVEV